MKLLSLNETAKLLNVHKNTLRVWDEKGALKAIRTKGGHRRYKEDEINAMTGEKITASNVDVVVVYCKIGDIHLSMEQLALLQTRANSDRCSCEEIIIQFISEGLCKK
jgi:excisionase family DNA binding protein